MLRCNSDLMSKSAQKFPGTKLPLIFQNLGSSYFLFALTNLEEEKGSAAEVIFQIKDIFLCFLQSVPIQTIYFSYLQYISSFLNVIGHQHVCLLMFKVEKSNSLS